MQAEDSDIGPAYAVLAENTDPSPDEIRAFPYESKMLLSHQPEVRLVDDVLVRQTDEQLQLVVPTQLRRRLFDLTLHFRYYLLGAKVILRTDHHSLLWLRMYKNPTGIMARWIETSHAVT